MNGPRFHLHRREALVLAAGLWSRWASATGGAAATGAKAGSARRAPLLQGLDGWRFPVETLQPEAQRYVDQGVLLVFGFNPEEAVRSLQAAVDLDPGCASAWWALAWAMGPNINSDMAPDAAPFVQQALRQARAHAARAAPARRALIEALSLRHPPGREIDEEAYAQRLLVLAQRHRRDAELAFLAAEAQLNLHPYDWWQPDGRPQPWTPGIEALLQRAMRLQPRHPGAHHYWIHLQEASPRPERARASADHLRHAFPGSGHLLHMPSHIDMRTGRYEEAIRANQRSIAADESYLAQVDAQGAYRVGYVAHNHHFLWAAAGMAGRQALALQAAQAAWPAACGPLLRDPGTAIVQQYGVLPYFTLVRFGQWTTLLRDTLPPDSPAPYPLAIWHFARGTALVRTGQPGAAQQELARLRAAAADPGLQGLRLKNINPAVQLVQIAMLTLQAELALSRGEPAAAVSLLREATATEDALAYDEPHLWLAPTRHALGAALLAAGQAHAAAQAYREDLLHYPGNGWSLGGLALALQQAGQPGAELAEAARQAFAGAERLPTGSRF